MALPPTQTMMVQPMTSMYVPANAGASMYMPMAPPAPPVAPAAPPAPAEAPTQVPPDVAYPDNSSFICLTKGMPEPRALKEESDAYGKALEAQLKKQSEAVIEEARIKKQMIEEEGKREIAAFQLQVEERLKMAMMNVDKEAQMQLMGLQEAAISRKTLREEEAAVKAAGFVKAKAMEEQANKSKDIRKQFAAAEAKLAAEYQAIMQASSKAMVPPAAPMVPQVPQYAPTGYAAPAYAVQAPAYAMAPMVVPQ